MRSAFAIPIILIANLALHGNVVDITVEGVRENLNELAKRYLGRRNILGQQTKFEGFMR
jgi:hypothetical protein